jgi:endogenous inhibitor of DNA gyrase (YacG/DUF329 family)
MNRPGQTANGPKPCPLCGKPASERYKPFCSKHCADVDLHRWLSGGYAIPGGADDEDEPPVPPEKLD